MEEIFYPNIQTQVASALAQIAFFSLAPVAILMCSRKRSAGRLVTLTFLVSAGSWLILSYAATSHWPSWSDTLYPRFVPWMIPSLLPDEMGGLRVAITNFGYLYGVIYGALLVAACDLSRKLVAWRNAIS